MEKVKTLKVSKIRGNSKLPVRAHRTDAGMDVFFCPSEPQVVILKPGQTTLFESGLRVGVPEGHMLQVMNKSGVASKKSLVVGACVIDSGYDGEVLINLHNIGNSQVTVEPGQKIAQAVLIPISTPSVVEVSAEELYESQTSRGAGGFGSTGDF